MPEWLKYVLTFMTGAAGSFFAPWANWGVEKKKIQLNNRRETLHRFKSIVNEFGYDQGIQMAAAQYAQIRRHLSKRWLALYEAEPSQQLEYHEMQNILLEDLANLERKWGLF